MYTKQNEINTITKKKTQEIQIIIILPYMLRPGVCANIWTALATAKTAKVANNIINYEPNKKYLTVTSNKKI